MAPLPTHPRSATGTRGRRHGYLSEPLVLHLADDVVGVSHHGDQHVDEQEGHQDHVHQEDKLQ